VFDQLTDALSASSWAYALIFAVVAGDAVLPLLPGETIVVTGGVLATSGDLEPGVRVPGRRGRARSPATRPATGSAASSAPGRPSGSCAAERGKRTLDWAQNALDRRARR
jgi:hypothetical protein